MRRSGLSPNILAGRRRLHSSLLPCCGGMNIMSFFIFPAENSSSFLAYVLWCQFSTYSGFVYLVKLMRLRRASSILAARAMSRSCCFVYRLSRASIPIVITSVHSGELLEVFLG